MQNERSALFARQGHWWRAGCTLAASSPANAVGQNWCAEELDDAWWVPLASDRAGPTSSEALFFEGMEQWQEKEDVAMARKRAVRLVFEQEIDEKADEVFDHLLLSSSRSREQFSSAETQGHDA